MSPSGLPKPIAFDGGMLLVAGAERLLAYNSSARHIWRALADGHTLADISATLADTFHIDQARAAAEVDAIIAHWRQEGLLDESVPAAVSSVDSGSCAPADIDWASRWTCRLGAHLVELAVQDAEAAALLRGPLRPLEMDYGTPQTRVEVRRVSGDGTSVVLRDGRTIRRAIRRDGLKEAVYGALLDFLWPDRPVETLIHAGAVARVKAAVCFPAASGRGKSTLIAHLCGRGFQYLTDDLTALDSSGDVLPLPVPMSLKEGSWTLLDSLLPELRSSPAASIGRTQTKWITPAGASSAQPTRLTGLIFSRYTAGRPALLQSIRPFDALLRLREAGVWLGHPLTDDRVARFAEWLERTPAYALEYDKLPEAAESIDGLERRASVVSDVIT